MLKFVLDRQAECGSSSDWRWDGRAWRKGDSWIVPLRHPALTHRMVTCEETVSVVSRERRRGDPAVEPGAPEQISYAELIRLAQETARWPIDYTMLRIDAGTVAVEAGVWAIAPIYLAGGRDRLAGSWQPTDLHDYADTSTLSDTEVARLLTRRHRYGHETVWRAVKRLTERSTATWQDGTLRLTYPSPAEHAMPRPLRRGADVLTAFEHALDTAVHRREFPAHQCGIELSGGLDSTNVAATLAERGGQMITAAAVLMDGSCGQAQRNRRRQLIEEFHCAGDITVDATEHLPFHPGGVRGRGLPVSPYSEPWIEAKQPMLAGLAACGVRWSFGGTGGDELMSVRACEKTGSHGSRPYPPWLGKRAVAAAPHSEEGIAPATVLRESTLLAFGSRTPQFLDKGLWPVSPLADPQLTRFCEWLPLPWRADKTLARLRLSGLGLPLSVYCGPRDDPRETLDIAFRRHVLPFLETMCVEGGVLVDSGYVDADGLRRTARAVRRMGEKVALDRTLFTIAAVEAGLRTCSAHAVG
ncbi:asparagine synthase-related protein [Nocardia sp. NPDC004168]|uniref:asparagine synthase-related protein n=1 Tax=Nocardia sp. NPDC004168 TaxID=3154452 RepID=UPI0033AA47AD